jgi:hypothetical protein
MFGIRFEAQGVALHASSTGKLPCARNVAKYLHAAVGTSHYGTVRIFAAQICRGLEKEHHPPCGIFRTVGIKSLKNTSDREEWKRGSVTVLEQVVERGINMTMG